MLRELGRTHFDHAIAVHAANVDWRGVLQEEAAQFARALGVFNERLDDARMVCAGALSMVSHVIVMLMVLMLGSAFSWNTLSIIALFLVTALAEVGYLIVRFSTMVMRYKKAEHDAVLCVQELVRSHPL